VYLGVEFKDRPLINVGCSVVYLVGEFKNLPLTNVGCSVVYLEGEFKDLPLINVGCSVVYLEGEFKDRPGLMWATLAQSVWRLAIGLTVWGSNPGGSEIFRTCPHRSWGPPSIPYDGYRVPFSGVKRPGHGVNHPSPSSAEGKEIVELYLFVPCGPLCPLPARTLLFTFYFWLIEILL
jgi:hypothetical protein